VAVISTLPVTLDGSLRGEVARAGQGADPPRATADPDRYGDGFGVWSGTSFSCPACVGRIGAVLAALPEPAGADEHGAQLAQAVAEIVGSGS
jgi:hypothetical protein